MKRKFFSAKFFELHSNLFSSLASDIDLREEITEHITHNDKNILDIYCKTGNMVIYMAKARPHAHIIGLESDEDFLRYAKRKKRRNFAKNVELMNISNLDFIDNSFDVVTLYFALSNMTIDSINRLLKKIRDLLKQNKRLIIVDYSYAKSKLSRFFSNLYYRFINYNKINNFLKIDLKEVLFDNGFKNIEEKDYNCIKLVSSIK